MNYSEAYKALATCPRLRERILEHYRSIGGDYHRWMQDDQAKMAQAISKIEDEVEFEKRNQEHREALKLVRRVLEDELDV